MKYTTNAPKGAALLDERMPGWAAKVDLDTFQIMSTERCILAQVYDSDYWSGKNELFTEDELDVPTFDATYPPYAFGFDYYSGGASPASLDAEWRELVSERQSKA